jgi:hypothetical protein
MKKHLFYLLAILFAVGCKKENPGNDMIWDFYPSDISFLLLDRYGDNLFNPQTEGNYLDNEIVAEYNGEKYPLQHPDTLTRAIPPQWLGLRTGLYYGYAGDDGTPAVLFGEFSPTADGKGYRGETFTISWGNGSTDEIKFDFYVTWAWDKKKKQNIPTVHTKLWIDGEFITEKELAAIAVVRGTGSTTRSWSEFVK